MNLKTLLTWTFACAVLSACSSDEITDKDTTVTGKDTWAAFNIQLPKSMTRAVDAYATSSETTVKTVAVYIADKTTGAIATSGIMALDDYKTEHIVNNIITTKVAVKTSPGEKLIWAVLNPTEAMHTQITSKTGLGGLQTAFNATVTDMTGGYQYATETITGHKGFVMASKEIQTKTLQADIKEDAAVGGTGESQNHFSIEVERAVAKVSAVAKENGIENKLPGVGAFGNFKYYVSQVNPATYIARWTDAVTQPKGYNIVTPNNDNDGSTVPWGNTAMQGTPLDVNLHGTAKSALNGIYVLENSMLAPLQQNSTCLVIQAKWTPTTVYQADGATTGTLNAAGDFWYYNGKYYMEAPAGLTTDEADKVKWTGGICHYRTYLYDKYTNNLPDAAGEKYYDVVRNTCYNVTINSVMAPGSNTPAPSPTPSPIVEDTWVSVDVDILVWTFANMDGVDLQ